jgi:tetratricopeptide (TPR) repeat protein
MLADYFSRPEIRAALAQSDFGGAIALLRNELNHETPNAEFHQIIGVLRLHSGQPDEALQEFREAERLAPRDPEPKRLQGQLLLSLGRATEALGPLLASLRLDPESEEGFFNAGLACQMLEKWESSIPLFQQTLKLNPGNTQALLNLGNALCLTGAAKEAMDCYSRVLAVEPDNAQALSSTGSALQRLNRPEEADEWHERAVTARPGDFQLHCNRGNALLERNRPQDALPHYRQALALAPERHEVANSLALAHLTLGEFNEGWQWMHRRMELQFPGLKSRHWDGRKAQGVQSLLVLSEQGLGDTLFFLRYLPLVAALGYRVSILAQSALKPLLAAQPYLHSVLSQGDTLPAFDAYATIMSLPRLLEPQLKGQLPPPLGPLRIPESAMKKAMTLIPDADVPAIGLTWAGNPKHQNDHNRSRSLEEFCGLLPHPNFRAFCLQKQWSKADQAMLLRHPGLVSLSPELSDFAMTAALISRLDLVITVDTAVAHLAGLLGVPVWIVLPHWPDWRWRLEGTASEWYPSARLFRQRGPGDWNIVKTELATALREFCPSARL